MTQPNLSGKALVAGVMGWPVAHSKSPRLHGFWLAQHGIDGAYIPMAVRPENLEVALRALPALGFRGVNLTIPHKEKAMAFVDEIDPLARKVGAINTIVVRVDQTLYGTNTDVFGFSENLKRAGFIVDKQKPIATILGAGGAARAILVALHEMGIQEIRIINRDISRAEALASPLSGTSCKIYGWEDSAKALVGSGLLVNTTSLGMTGQPPLDIDLAPLSPDAWVTDAVYAPLETALLKQARQRGLRTVDGLGMLLYQAQPGFSAWFCIEPQVTPELRAFVLAET